MKQPSRFKRLPRALRTSLTLFAGAAAAALLLMALYWTKCRVGIDLSSSHNASSVEPFKTLYWMAENRIPF